jgi:hypothetical protein
MLLKISRIPALRLEKNCVRSLSFSFVFTDIFSPQQAFGYERTIKKHVRPFKQSLLVFLPY